jgi:hypothetical protein
VRLRLGLVPLAFVAVFPSSVAGAAGPRATYSLYGSYPNLVELRGYFLNGINPYDATNPATGSDRASLWFEPLGGGAFKQFPTAPYAECQWDLLRWDPGAQGVLVYLATDAECSSDHTRISFSPGIGFMPKTWAVGKPWSESGVSQTVYSDDGVAVCAGANTWASSIRGLVRMPDGALAVHTQTNESQTLGAIAGAPASPACPAGQETQFSWQENYYLATPIGAGTAGGLRSASAVGLARSTGGNQAIVEATGHEEWNSLFTTWDRLPPTQVGTLTTTTASIPNGSAGNTISFTYTAPPDGLANGLLRIFVPPGWTRPVTTNGPGCTGSTGGVVAVRGRVITVSSLDLPGNGQAAISYGATSGGACAAGDGATASTVPGAPAWFAEVRSAGEPFAFTQTAPSIDVDAADGTGTLAVTPTAVAPDASGVTLDFVFTAPAGGIDDGAVQIALPPGWTAPVTGDAPGCTTAKAGTITTSGQTITWSNLTLPANTSATLVYGASSQGYCASGDGASAPGSTGPSIFSTDEMSTSDGTWQPIDESPTIVFA